MARSLRALLLSIGTQLTSAGYEYGSCESYGNPRQSEDFIFSPPRTDDAAAKKPVYLCGRIFDKIGELEAYLNFYPKTLPEVQWVLFLNISTSTSLDGAATVSANTEVCLVLTGNHAQLIGDVMPSTADELTKMLRQKGFCQAGNDLLLTIGYNEPMRGATEAIESGNSFIKDLNESYGRQQKATQRSVVTWVDIGKEALVPAGLVLDTDSYVEPMTIWIHKETFFKSIPGGLKEAVAAFQDDEDFCQKTLSMSLFWCTRDSEFCKVYSNRLKDLTFAYGEVYPLLMFALRLGSDVLKQIDQEKAAQFKKYFKDFVNSIDSIVKSCIQFKCYHKQLKHWIERHENKPAKLEEIIRSMSALFKVSYEIEEPVSKEIAMQVLDSCFEEGWEHFHVLANGLSFDDLTEHGMQKVQGLVADFFNPHSLLSKAVEFIKYRLRGISIEKVSKDDAHPLFETVFIQRQYGDEGGMIMTSGSSDGDQSPCTVAYVLDESDYDGDYDGDHKEGVGSVAVDISCIDNQYADESFAQGELAHDLNQGQAPELTALVPKVLNANLNGLPVEIKPLSVPAAAVSPAALVAVAPIVTAANDLKPQQQISTSSASMPAAAVPPAALVAVAPIVTAASNLKHQQQKSRSWKRIAAGIGSALLLGLGIVGLVVVTHGVALIPLGALIAVSSAGGIGVAASVTPPSVIGRIGASLKSLFCCCVQPEPGLSPAKSASSTNKLVNVFQESVVKGQSRAGDVPMAPAGSAVSGAGMFPGHVMKPCPNGNNSSCSPLLSFRTS